MGVVHQDLDGHQVDAGRQARQHRCREAQELHRLRPHLIASRARGRQWMASETDRNMHANRRDDMAALLQGLALTQAGNGRAWQGRSLKAALY